MFLPVLILLFAGLLLYAGFNNVSVADALNTALGRHVSGGLGSLLPQSTTTGGSSSPGSTNTAGGGSAAGGGFANPFPGGWSPSRLDMGYDGTFKGSIASPVAGTVTYASDSFSNWGGFVEVAADHPIPGLPSNKFYFAEGLHPIVRAGQHVTAGQKLAIPANNHFNGITGNIEWGLAQPGAGLTDPLAKFVSNPKQMVLNFAAWVEKELGLAKPTDTSNAGYP